MNTRNAQESLDRITGTLIDRRSLVSRAAVIGAGVGGMAVLPRAGVAAQDATPAASQGTTLAAAATAFLATLTADEQASVMFDWSDTTQKQRWSNFPQEVFQRDGLMWGDLGSEAQAAWLALLEAAMSPEGYQRVMAEWEAEQVLANEKDSGSGAGGPGGGASFGKDYYWLALIGEPSATEAWQIQFGGHHIAVNITVQGENIAYTPPLWVCSGPPLPTTQGPRSGRSRTWKTTRLH